MFGRYFSMSSSPVCAGLMCIRAAMLQVTAYVDSPEFKLMMENIKKKKREDAMVK